MWLSVYILPDMEFVKDFQAKNFTPSISPNFNSFSKKKHKKWVKMEKFAPLAKILHCRRQWQHGQIPTLVDKHLNNNCRDHCLLKTQKARGQTVELQQQRHRSSRGLNWHYKIFKLALQWNSSAPHQVLGSRDIRLLWNRPNSNRN